MARVLDIGVCDFVAVCVPGNACLPYPVPDVPGRPSRCHCDVAMVTLPRCRLRGDVATTTWPRQRCHDDVATVTLSR